MMERSIIHVDMDAFYASVEQRDEPELAGKPLVVIGGNSPRRGVVCAASYEARAFGVRAGMPTYQVRERCPGAVYRTARISRYTEICRQFHGVFADYTPVIESVGLDEAFLDVTTTRHLFGSAAHIGHLIKQRIRSEIGLKCTVGIAANKLLAKLGSDLGKPDGFMVFDAQIVHDVLPGIVVGKLWGIGPATETVLAMLNVKTLGDLRHCPKEVLEHHLGPHAASVLHSMAYGEDQSPVVPYALPKSFGAEETFETNIGSESELVGHLYRLVDRVARSLRAHRMQARTVYVKARYTDFTTVGYAQSLPTPSALTQELRAVAHALLTVRLGRNGRPLRLLGVSLHNLTKPGEIQEELPFFEGRNTEQWSRVDALLDTLQNQYGTHTVRLGGTNEDGIYKRP